MEGSAEKCITVVSHLDLWHRDGHWARLLRLPDIPSGHVGVSTFFFFFFRAK